MAPHTGTDTRTRCLRVAAARNIGDVYKRQVNWLLVEVFEISVGASWLGAILNLVVAAVVLMIADRFVPGMKVGGFVGALIAAIAIAVVAWLIGLLLPIETNPTQQGLLLLNALI